MLPNLPSGEYGSGSTAAGINNLGEAVGNSTGADGETHAVLWRDGQILDLNDLLDPGQSYPPGLLLRFGDSINDAGQITGDYVADGSYGGFVLTPIADNSGAGQSISVVPEPTNLMLLCASPVLLLRRRCWWRHPQQVHSNRKRV
jgi:probable HAF family extracellular repeat protein